MAVCRVYLCTFRRPKLLARAVDSLLTQTFGDWVCELHNDDPQDHFPAELVARIADPRITVIDHQRNFGPTATFNLFFKHIEEPFFTILEDDNWWEPDFLQTVVSTILAYPDVQVAWANMRYWQEQADGSWSDTGRNIWELQQTEPFLMHWPDRRQIHGALHSNGAMLARSSFEYFEVPESTNFAAIEPFRERTFVHPLLFVPRRLANFAVTRASARPIDRADWVHAVTVLTGTFVSEVSLSRDQIAALWADARKPPRWTHVLFVCAWHFARCRSILRQASLPDWLWAFAYTARHPQRTLAVLRLLREKRPEEDFLVYHTRRREAAYKAAILHREPDPKALSPTYGRLD